MYVYSTGYCLNERKRETQKEERQKRMLKADRGRQTDEDAIDRLRKRGARKK